MTTATRYLGTCPVCEREQKLHKMVLVHHGYQRPGDGYIHADCPGVGWPPFELSPDGTIAYVERHLQPWLEREQTFLEMLLAGTVTELYVETFVSAGWGKRERSTKKLTPADGHEFREAVRRKISETQRLIPRLTEDIAERTEKVRRWIKRPVRTEQEVVQARERMTAARRSVIDEARAARQAKRAALDAKQAAREQEKFDLMEEYAEIFTRLASADTFDPAAAKEHWVKMFKRKRKKGYLDFYPSELQIEPALSRLGLAVRRSHGNGWEYANDLGWEPRP